MKVRYRILITWYEHNRGTLRRNLMDKTIASSVTPPQFKFISKRSPDYKLEFINGALSNITPRGEIVCDFHLEVRDIPTEKR
jgi:hypothetical protein